MFLPLFPVSFPTQTLSESSKSQWDLTEMSILDRYVHSYSDSQWELGFRVGSDSDILHLNLNLF